MWSYSNILSSKMAIFLRGEGLFMTFQVKMNRLPSSSPKVVFESNKNLDSNRGLVVIEYSFVVWKFTWLVWCLGYKSQICRLQTNKHHQIPTTCKHSPAIITSDTISQRSRNGMLEILLPCYNLPISSAVSCFKAGKDMLAHVRNNVNIRSVFFARAFWHLEKAKCLFFSAWRSQSPATFETNTSCMVVWIGSNVWMMSSDLFCCFSSTRNSLLSWVLHIGSTIGIEQSIATSHSNASFGSENPSNRALNSGDWLVTYNLLSPTNTMKPCMFIHVHVHICIY